MAAGTTLFTLTLLLVLFYLQVTQQSQFGFTRDFFNSGDNFNKDGSEGTTSTGTQKSKTSDIEAGSTTKKQKPKPAYRTNTFPLIPEITPEKEDLIKLVEENLSKSGCSFPWNFSELPDGRKNYFCIKAFKQESIGTYITQDMNADCDISINLPAGGRLYYGQYTYYKPLVEEGKTFTGDFMRCNCAYKKFSTEGKSITVAHSKRFFYLLKRRETLYYVLTIIGDMQSSRRLKIINVLNVPKQEFIVFL